MIEMGGGEHHAGGSQSRVIIGWLGSLHNGCPLVTAPAASDLADQRLRVARITALDPVGSQKEVAQGPAQQHCDRGPASVLGPVVQQVAALAPRREVLELAVGWVVVEVTSGEADQGPAKPVRLMGTSCPTTLLIVPGAILAIEPAPVTYTEDDLTVWSAASFTAAVGTPKTNGS